MFSISNKIPKLDEADEEKLAALRRKPEKEEDRAPAVVAGKGAGTTASKAGAGGSTIIPGSLFAPAIARATVPAAPSEVSPETIAGEELQPFTHEDMLALRTLTALMAIVSIAAFCIHTHAPAMVAFLYAWGALCGSYISFYMRNRKSKWLLGTTVLGILIVFASFVDEAFKQFYGAGNLLLPFVRILAGLQVLQLFDMKTRSDVCISALIGMALLGCVAGEADKDIAVGFLVLAYICLGTGLLYFYCLAQSQAKYASAGSRAPLPPKETIPEETPVKGKPRQFFSQRSSAVIPIFLLPFVTTVIFCSIPRTGSVLDHVMYGMLVFLHKMNNPHKFLETLPIFQEKLGRAPGAKSGLPPLIKESTDAKRSGGEKEGKNGDKKGDREGSAPNQNPNLPALVTAPTDQPEGTTGSAAKGEPQKQSQGTEEGIDETSLEVASSPKKGKPVDKETVLFTVKTTQPVYMRNRIFDTYNGQAWTNAINPKAITAYTTKEGNVGLAAFKYFEEAIDVKSKLLGIDCKQEVELRRTLGYVIPAAWIPYSINHQLDNISVDARGTLQTTNLLGAGTKYSVYSVIPTYDLKAMSKSAVVSQELAEATRQRLPQYLQLPERLPDELIEDTDRLIGTEKNWYQAAQKVIGYLRKNYKYSLDKPDSEAGTDPILAFVTTRKGTCGEYATTFAMMMRMAGIPTRIVGGYTVEPPKQSSSTAGHNGASVVRVKHRHAWAEVYIPDYGFVEFDPTPGGFLPQQTPKGLVQRSLEEKYRTAPKQPPPGTVSPPRATGQPAQNDPNRNPTSNNNVGSNAPQPAAGSSTGAPAKSPVANKSTTGNSSTTQTAASSPPPSVKVKIPLPTINWKPFLIIVAVWVTALILIRQVLALSKKKKAVMPAVQNLANLKKPTRLYLQVLADMDRLQVERSEGHTCEEVALQVNKAIAGNEVLLSDVKKELPGLVSQFMEIYAVERFGPGNGESTDGARLASISDKIHELVSRGLASTSTDKVPN